MMEVDEGGSSSPDEKPKQQPSSSQQGSDGSDSSLVESSEIACDKMSKLSVSSKNYISPDEDDNDDDYDDYDDEEYAFLGYWHGNDNCAKYLYRRFSQGFVEEDGKMVYFIHLHEKCCGPSRCIDLLKKLGCDTSSAFIGCSGRSPYIFNAILDEKQAALLEGFEEVAAVVYESEMLILD